VDDIPYGVKFPTYLAEKLGECRVELVIIGPSWLTLATPTGQRRLDDPNDFVRIEVEHGLRNGLIVIPVLVDNATLPHAEELPETIRELIEFNAAQVRFDPDFSTDMDRLIRQLDRWLGAVSPPTSTVTPPAGTTTTPVPSSNPQAAFIEQQLQHMRTAVLAQDWSQVSDSADYLLARVPSPEQNVPIEVYRLLGQAQYQQGDYAAARRALDIAVARTGDDLQLLLLTATVLVKLQDDAAAASLLKQALGLPTQPAERLEALRLYIPVLARQGQWTEVLKRCDDLARITAAAADDPLVLSLRLDALTHLNREADALALARTLTVRRDATVDWWLTRARLARRVANDDNEVKTSLDAAERLAPNTPIVAEARRVLLPPPAPPIAPDHFPQRLASLGFTGASVPVNGKPVEYIVPPLCEVPAGPFLMGSDPKRDPRPSDNEKPQHSITLPAYQIARYPVTVAEYACFVRAGQQEPSDWKNQLTKLDHPVVNVSWHDAMAYAKWLAERSGQPWCLPTEAEWEKAARGSDGRIYPWGDQFDQACCNTSESGIKTTTPVGSYPGGASPYGVLDLAGNVWEWTSTLYKPYPYNEADGRESVNSTDNRVLRGGSWLLDAWFARAAYRFIWLPDDFDVPGGFRLVLRSAPISV
jgi:formylglycine-generating enzyme required for sulfatase activity